MFTYIHLKNFKNFSDIHFNLCDKHGTPKKFILIYGNNGTGKTNIASAFLVLGDSLRTMNMRAIMEDMLKDDPDLKNNDLSPEYIKTHYKGMESIIENNKMVATTPEETMYLEFGFTIDDNQGRYIIKTNNTQVIHEHLEFLLVKNKTTYFDITPSTKKINSKLFNDRKAKVDIVNTCNQFWGKHTFLSIALHEVFDKSDDFIWDQLNGNFQLLLKHFLSLSCKVKFGSYFEQGGLSLPYAMLASYEDGKIPKDKEELLDHAESMINDFIKRVFKDARRAYYKRDIKEDIIHYHLILTKLIADKERDIDFNNESTGTQLLLYLLPYLLVTVHGYTTVIDEFDTGMHDLLVQSLVKSMYNNISGQLIMTTHNTILMDSDSDVAKECIYIINEKEGGNREIETLTHYDKKIHENTSIRRQYL